MCPMGESAVPVMLGMERVERYFSSIGTATRRTEDRGRRRGEERWSVGGGGN